MNKTCWKSVCLLKNKVFSKACSSFCTVRGRRIAPLSLKSEMISDGDKKTCSASVSHFPWSCQRVHDTSYSSLHVSVDFVHFPHAFEQFSDIHDLYSVSQYPWSLKWWGEYVESSKDHLLPLRAEGVLVNTHVGLVAWFCIAAFAQIGWTLTCETM